MKSVGFAAAVALVVTLVIEIGARSLGYDPGIVAPGIGAVGGAAMAGLALRRRRVRNST